MPLSERVRELREGQGLKQKELADRTGITQATISRIEGGEIEELKAGTLKRLAEALDASVDYLIGRTESSGPKEIAAYEPGAGELVKTFAALERPAKEELLTYARYLKQRREGKMRVLRLLSGKRRPKVRFRRPRLK